MIAVRVFVSHAFDDATYDGGLEVFREQVRTLVDSACGTLSVMDAKVMPELIFEARAYGRPLMPEIRRQIGDCDFLVADISQADDGKGPVNPNVMYEIGFAMALEKPVIVMRRNTQPPPPSDIRDLLAGSYERLDDIPEKFGDIALTAVTETLVKANVQDRRIETSLEKLWFPKDTRSIAIVCAPDPEPSKFSDVHEPNYVHIDRFDDRDALMELATFFARRYPRAQVLRYLCGEMPQEALDGNLVILGGPGCVAEEGNEVGRDLMHMLKSQVSYPEEGDGLVWDGGPLRRTEFDQEGRVIEDWGSILAAPNPYNPTARVVVLHGTNTYGTLGAATALIDKSTAMRNYLQLAKLGLEDRLTGQLNFEVLVRTQVGPNRKIKPPALDLETIRQIVL